MAICDSDAEDRAALRAILSLFPGLVNVRHELTSRPSERYNCIAFALGEDDSNYWPLPLTNDSFEWTYWPRRIAREESVAVFQKLFESKGYANCANANLELGFEKIALYCDASGKPTHAARQITTGPHAGQWQSKIGKEGDIRHETLTALEGAEYGKVFGYFARAVGT